MEDWIEKVKKCKEDLLVRGKWKESDICIILTNSNKKGGIKYLQFFLKLKSRYFIVILWVIIYFYLFIIHLLLVFSF
jgi:hypothetical protein